uniref:Uncharacterized protein n=1 Tax=Oryza punctata TaxID=4537 RepID=A0A0E0KAV1_ORYPU
MATRVEEEAPAAAVEEEERAPAAALLRRIMAPSAWRAPPTAAAAASSSYLVASEAGGVEKISMLSSYERLPSVCGTAFSDDDGGARSSSPPACPPRAARLLWGALTRAVQKPGRCRCPGDEEAGVTTKERRWSSSSWRPDPDRRWPVQGWS